MSRPTVGFAGLTHLGVNSAAAALARGFPVVGYDENADVVARLARSEATVVEPGLDDLLKKHAPQARYTTRIEELERCDLVYIAADVPTDDSGASDLSPIRKLIDGASKALNPHAVLAILCQVPPGFTRSLGLPAERLVYQVETLIFGRAVERALHPERFILGCADPAAPLPAVLREYLGAFGCPLLPMRYESAELAKIAINCCLVSSVSVANTLAELCEKIGADWSEIVPSLKLDARIGPSAYLSPGLGIAGGNLERDLATVMRFAQEHGTDARVVKSWVENSRHRRDWAVRTIRSAVLDRNPGATIAVWGLAYKENTHSTKNSPSLATLSALHDAAVRLHDPVVPADAARHPRASAARDALDAAKGANALMILTPWPQYRQIAPADIARAMRGKVVLDPYGVLDRRAAGAAGLTVHSLGVPPLVPHA